VSDNFTKCEVLYAGGAVQLYIDTAPTTIKGPKGDAGSAISNSSCNQPVYDQDTPVVSGTPPNPISDPPSYEGYNIGPKPSAVCGDRYLDLATGIIYELQADPNSTLWDFTISHRTWFTPAGGGSDYQANTVLQSWQAEVQPSQFSESYAMPYESEMTTWAKYVLGPNSVTNSANGDARASGSVPEDPILIQSGNEWTKLLSAATPIDYFTDPWTGEGWDDDPAISGHGKWPATRALFPCASKESAAYGESISVTSPVLAGGYFWTSPMTLTGWSGVTFPVNGTNTYGWDLHYAYATNYSIATGSLTRTWVCQGLYGVNAGQSVTGPNDVVWEPTAQTTANGGGVNGSPATAYADHQPSGASYPNVLGNGIQPLISLSMTRTSCTWVQVDTLAVPSNIQSNPLMVGAAHHLQKESSEASSHVWDGSNWNEMYQIPNYDGGTI
jgi:hypothetical protein